MKAEVFSLTKMGFCLVQVPANTEKGKKKKKRKNKKKSNLES